MALSIIDTILQYLYGTTIWEQLSESVIGRLLTWISGMLSTAYGIISPLSVLIVYFISWVIFSIQNIFLILFMCEVFIFIIANSRGQGTTFLSNVVSMNIQLFTVVFKIMSSIIMFFIHGIIALGSLIPGT